MMYAVHSAESSFRPSLTEWVEGKLAAPKEAIRLNPGDGNEEGGGGDEKRKDE